RHYAEALPPTAPWSPPGSPPGRHHERRRRAQPPARGRDSSSPQAKQRGKTSSPIVLLFASRSAAPATARRYPGPHRGQGCSLRCSPRGGRSTLTLIFHGKEPAPIKRTDQTRLGLSLGGPAYLDSELPWQDLAPVGRPGKRDAKLGECRLVA